MAEKKIYHINFDLKAEIRKIEKIEGSFKNKNGEEIATTKYVLSVDDMDDNRIYLTDKDLTRISMYKRGVIGNFRLRIDCEEEYGTKSKISILDFVPVEE